MYKKIVFIIIFSSLSACASHVPIVDTDGVDMVNYQQDFQRCQEYQKQVKASWKSGALGGAVIGGLLGAIDGDVGGGMLAGGVVGTAESHGDKADRKNKVIRECLRQRGYKVLN